MDDDYKGSAAHTITNLMASNQFEPPGDKDKAAKVIYEVIASEGAGAGLESEVQLVLGADALKRAEEVRDKLQHVLQIFGDVARSVGRSGEK